MSTDREGPIARLMIECPVTKRLVFTGLAGNRLALRTAAENPGVLQCPDCGGTHAWSSKDVQIVRDWPLPPPSR